MNTIQSLIPGQKYTVIRLFKDFDQIVHPVGEKWNFVNTSFLPYEDGMTVFIQNEQGMDSSFRLKWREDQQADIINHFMDYVEKI